MLVPVYDIKNCGPNHRYTANGKLIHNCDSINVQNLPRGSKIKTAIAAPSGHVIVGADLSAIELRMGLWFAGQQDKVALLGAGVDLYKDFASVAYSVSIDDVDSDKRFVGKCCQLSLLYGTGAKKLRNTILQLSGIVDIGEAEAERLTTLYRDEYKNVVRAWGDAGEALQKLREGNPHEIGLGGLTLLVEPGRGIMMPSGLFLNYPGLRREDKDGKKVWVYDTYKGPRYLYAAKVFQNAIQALARCVMGEAMVRVNKKYPVALTIHDALYVLAPEERAEEVRQELILTMRKPPKWALDLPLDAEAGYGPNLSFKMWKF